MVKKACLKALRLVEEVSSPILSLNLRNTFNHLITLGVSTLSLNSSLFCEGGKEKQWWMGCGPVYRTVKTPALSTGEKAAAFFHGVEGFCGDFAVDGWSPCSALGWVLWSGFPTLPTPLSSATAPGS